jgi:hypothetical protein
MKTGTRKNTKSAGSAAQNSDLRAEIASLAYELWLADGCREGNDLGHWFQAERELLSARQRIPAE